MLSSQLRSGAAKTTRELGVDVKFVSWRSRSEPDDRQALFQQLDAVVTHLKASKVVDNLFGATDWIEDECSASMLRFADQGTVFFFGRKGPVAVGLGGSIHHLVGHRRGSTVDVTFSFLPYLLDSLRYHWETLDQKSPEFQQVLLNAGRSEDVWPRVIGGYAREPGRRRQRVRFLARRLLTAKYRDMTTVLATPLYVALSSGRPGPKSA